MEPQNGSLGDGSHGKHVLKQNRYLDSLDKMCAVGLGRAGFGYLTLYSELALQYVDKAAAA